MTAAVLRCRAAHPDRPDRECRAKLAEVMPGSMDLRQTSELGPGCTRLRCPRCGTEYVVCPVEQVA